MEEKNYDIIIDGEPEEVTQIRHKILETFKDLEFYEEGHRYLLHGKPLISVTNLTHKFQEPFDENTQAEIYAEKHGETKEYWLKQWHLNSFKATSQGTKIHAWGESRGWQKNGHPELICEEILPQYHKETDTLVTWHPKEEAIEKFINDLPESYHLVLNEAKVFSGLNPKKELNTNTLYCGTFDLLYYYKHPTDDSKSGLVILDYKTNKSLISEFSRTRGKMLYPPFEDLYSESLGVYYLQLNLYQIPLEDIGLKVLGRKIIWLKDDGTYEKYDVPNLTDKLRKVV